MLLLQEDLLRDSQLSAPHYAHIVAHPNATYYYHLLLSTSPNATHLKCAYTTTPPNAITPLLPLQTPPHILLGRNIHHHLFPSSTPNATTILNAIIIYHPSPRRHLLPWFISSHTLKRHHRSTLSSPPGRILRGLLDIDHNHELSYEMMK